MYTKQVIDRILKQVARRKITPKRAFQKLRNLSYESLGFARLDHHRFLRKGLPEVVYAPGKTFTQLEKISKTLMKNGAPVLITRLEEEKFDKLKKRFPKLSYSAKAQIAYFRPHPKRGQARDFHAVPVPFLKGKRQRFANGLVAIVTAGTSDIPVAEEARITLEVMDRKAKTFYDLGIAGLHRLLDHISEIEKADVIICVAGMEGALPSVLAGLVSKPVIAVPTSVGYGSNFKGIAALLTMLNSCAQGLAVVNIDSGFNAASFAHLILNSQEAIKLMT